MSVPLPLAAFDYHLPGERIATQPARPRDHSRMMVLHRDGDGLSHARFDQLPECLTPADLLVVNETKVIPARLRLRRLTGGAAELLPYKPLDGALLDATCWECLGRPGSALKPGAQLVAADGVRVTVQERVGDAVRVRTDGPLWQLMSSHGEVPLPPYVERGSSGPTRADASDYQTIFAAIPGAVAAPTASLHFTERVLANLAATGVGLARLILHVGPGTFLPVRPDHEQDVRSHQMHPEWYDIPAETVSRIVDARQRGGRVVAVGTTCVRALETWARSGKTTGESSLFIYDGFEFGCVGGMVTNFHLPRSTLLMLVCAFSGHARILGAYQEAIEAGYRFYSYGDAMLLL